VEKAKVRVKKKAGKCERCGRIHGMMHGAHILPEGAYPLMSAEDENLLCFCFRCHFFFWHKHPLEAAAWFNEKWPRRYKKLRKMAEEKKKHVVNWKLQYDIQIQD